MNPFNLDLYREASVGGATLGRIYGNNQFICDTLEDEIRELEGVPVAQWKRYGITAIPFGTYEVVFENSPKFGPETLTLRNVPGFTEIRIHAGNSAKDTLGCILTGTRNGPSTVRDSVKALGPLKAMVKNAIIRGEMVRLTIHRTLSLEKK